MVAPGAQVGNRLEGVGRAVADEVEASVVAGVDE